MPLSNWLEIKKMLSNTLGAELLLFENHSHSSSRHHQELFTGVQKLYGTQISQFLPCMLQFLQNLQLFSCLTT